MLVVLARYHDILSEPSPHPHHSPRALSPPFSSSYGRHKHFPANSPDSSVPYQVPCEKNILGSPKHCIFLTTLLEKQANNNHAIGADSAMSAEPWPWAARGHTTLGQGIACTGRTETQ